MTGWRVGYVAAPAGDPRGDGQGPPVRDHVGPDDGPGRGAGRDRRGRGRRRADASPSTTAAAGCIVDGLNALGSRDVRAARRVLRLPADRLDRSRRRDVHGAAPDRGARGGRARAARSGRRAPATSGCATRPPTSGSRRRSAGSAGSSSGSATAHSRPGLMERRIAGLARIDDVEDEPGQGEARWLDLGRAVPGPIPRRERAPSARARSSRRSRVVRRPAKCHRTCRGTVGDAAR